MRNDREHFFNDVKYATVSLIKDRRQLLARYREEVLTLNVKPMKERFANEYEPLIQMLDDDLHKKYLLIPNDELQRIHEIYTHALMDLSYKIKQVVSMREQMHSMYGIFTGSRFEELQIFVKKTMNLNAVMTPVPEWFSIESQGIIQSLIDEAQTRVEDKQKCLKRILKVWKEDILEEQCLTMVKAFCKQSENSLKFISGSYWIQRKRLRALFKEDADLLTQQEYEVLYHNLLLLRESESWLKEHEEMLYSVLGHSYKEENTNFEDLRKQFISFSNLPFTKDHSLLGEITERLCDETEYASFYELIENFGRIDVDQIHLEFARIFSIIDTTHYKKFAIDDMLNLCDQTHQVIEHLCEDYHSIFDCLLHHRDEFTLHDMRKAIYLIERVQQKTQWMNEHRKEAEQLFGPMDAIKTQDWEELRKKMAVQDSQEEDRQAVTEKIKEESQSQTVSEALNDMNANNQTDVNEFSYNFVIYEETQAVNITSPDDEMLTVLQGIIRVEQPIHEKMLLKRAAGLLELSRVTPRLKQKLEELKPMLHEYGYECEDKFIQSICKEKIEFRITQKDQKKRELQMIAVCEWAAGIQRVIEVKKEVPLDSISKILCEQLTFPRRNQQFHDCVNAGMKYLKEKGLIIRHSGGWRLVQDTE